jgi:endonuclease/exonuclease/phosphatase family metal-dependent hydrolase
MRRLPLRLRVATWNVRIGIETSMQCLLDALHQTPTLDLLALQEIAVDWRMGERMDQPAFLARGLGLPYCAFAGALTDDAGGRFGVALLSRWPFRTVDVTQLPRETDEQRVALRVRLDTEPSLVVVNTHLSVQPAERLRQAALVRRRFDEAAGPGLLLGDFNDVPDSETLAALRGPTAESGGPLIDAFDAAGAGPPETFSVCDPHRRIDYILARGGLSPTGVCRVWTENRSSDHFPVVAELGLEELLVG